MSAAIAAGAMIHGDSPASCLRREGAGWKLETDHGSLLADQVLLCTNGYTTSLWATKTSMWLDRPMKTCWSSMWLPSSAAHVI